MQIPITFIIVMCIFASFHPIKENPVNDFQIDIGFDYPVVINEEVTSLSEIKDRHLVKQNYDYSCGSAALSTLLNFYLGENFTERQVIQGLMEYGNKQNITERRAFSLLDMKKFVDKLGYQGTGYKADMNDLLELDQPCIIPIEFFGYRHFTVFKGIYDQHIFLSDPFRGNTSYTLSEFETMWYENVIFIAAPVNTQSLTALALTIDDLQYIHEDAIEDILFNYGPVFRSQDERDFNFTLPDEYRKYKN